MAGDVAGEETVVGAAVTAFSSRHEMRKETCELVWNLKLTFSVIGAENRWSLD